MIYFRYMKILCSLIVCAGLFTTSAAIECYQCSGSDPKKPFQCNEWLSDDIDIKPESCDSVFGAKYCIKHVGRYEGGIGAKRFCSSLDLGNYCNYVRQPGDLLTYRTCIYTCTGDGCNPATRQKSQLSVLLGTVALTIHQLLQSRFTYGYLNFITSLNLSCQMRLRMNQKPDSKANALKYVSLVTLTLQNAVLGLSMRYSRTREGDLFISSTAVLMAEVVKLITCLAIVYVDSGGIVKLFGALHSYIIKQPMDTLKVGVPSLLYVIQNNLLYLSASHLDAATYQVTYQLKIFTTAVFSVLILKKQLIFTQWLSLVSLIGGIVLVQLAQDKAPAKVPNGMEQNHVIGFLAALGACCLSGFAGVYFEKILKGSDISVWMRNIQLSLLSIPIGLITCFAQDSPKILDNGFFFGYDGFVVYLVILQATGGLLVALVVKYADNILKGFATSLAIIISCVVSIYLFNFHLTVKFSLGAVLVIFAIFLYGYQPKKKQSPTLAHKV